MKFNLKEPCKDYPFVLGSNTNTTLAKGRLEGIIEDIRNDLSFTCHKTLDLPSRSQQHCAGAMIFLEKEERPNQIMRIAERVGLYNHSELNMNVNIVQADVM